MPADDCILAPTPGYLPEVTEDVLRGAQDLRRAFLELPRVLVQRGGHVFDNRRSPSSVALLHHGFAYQCCTLPDGRRAILDILVSGDVIGLEHILSPPHHEFIAADTVGYRAMPAATLRELMNARPLALKVFALMAEARARIERHAAMVARLDARERVGALLLDIYDRLMRRNLIARPTFNLPLTQEQLADYLGLTMVHVNRTLRRLREERLALLDRHVVIIQNLAGLREMVHGSGPCSESVASGAADAPGSEFGATGGAGQRRATSQDASQ